MIRPEPIFNELKADTVAAASAECGLQKWGYHLPGDLQACLRANLHALCLESIFAYLTIPSPHCGVIEGEPLRSPSP